VAPSVRIVNLPLGDPARLFVSRLQPPRSCERGQPSTTPDDSTTTADRATEDAISAGTESGDNAAVLRALATSIALLPQAPPAEGEERPEGAVALPVIEQDGQRYIPVFTSEESLRAAGADPDTAVRIPVAELAATGHPRTCGSR
jgi:hypothetical protein